MFRRRFGLRPPSSHRSTGPTGKSAYSQGSRINWWIVHTRNLADCILADAPTNALLAVYVIAGNQWQYWPL